MMMNRNVFLIAIQIIMVLARNDPSRHNINVTDVKQLQAAGEAADSYGTDRFGRGFQEGCSKDSIYVTNDRVDPLPSGIPCYLVVILNICNPDIEGFCNISDIHLSCEWFSSARLINPRIFKRIAYNDCLVNNGEPISSGKSIAFHYANTDPYPLAVSSMTCK